MRLMLHNFQSFTVSLLSHLFKKKFDIFLQLTALEPKKQKKSKKRYKLQRELGGKKEEEEERRKRDLGELDWTVGGGRNSGQRLEK
jgi:hypothetical protein